MIDYNKLNVHGFDVEKFQNNLAIWLILCPFSFLMTAYSGPISCPGWLAFFFADSPDFADS